MNQDKARRTQRTRRASGLWTVLASSRNCNFNGAALPVPLPLMGLEWKKRNVLQRIYYLVLLRLRVNGSLSCTDHDAIRIYFVLVRYDGVLEAVAYAAKPAPVRVSSASWG